jgi:malonyl-CoA decarboxylase
MRLPWRRKRSESEGVPVQRAIGLSRKLITRAGEAEGTRVAGMLATLCCTLDDADLLAFFRWLVGDLGPDQEGLKAAASAYLADPDAALAASLTVAAEPRRQELLRRLNTATGGTALIVALRGRLLTMLRAHPELAPLDADLRHLLASWFNRGFLELRRIDWHTSAAILEKLIAYEAVHAIRGWEDLRGRLGGDRRCYGFFHPALPEEPLIFVEVALTDEISDAIGPLLDHPPMRTEPHAPTTAIFYSISNCQPGLRGISFGNFLIKQITQNLKTETPSLEVFATLSPVPGFRRWLDAGGNALSAPGCELGDDLVRLCAHYLSGVQPDGSQGVPRDPVATFHLSNGARVDRINPDADLSEKGQAESCGIMVNYRYLPEAIVANHERFAERGEVALAPAVAALRLPRREGHRVRKATDAVKSSTISS